MFMDINPKVSEKTLREYSNKVGKSVINDFSSNTTLKQCKEDVLGFHDL